MTRVLPFLLLCVSASAADLICEGVLGNSGEQGATLVRFGSVADSLKGAIGGGKAMGIGVAIDETGSLWDRGGSGTLNRYAPDGRLLGQYRIPQGSDGHDQLTIVGDTLVMLLGRKLYTLNVSSKSGIEAKSLNRSAECMSYGSWSGSVAISDNGKISWVNAANGEAKEALAAKDVAALEADAQGALYVQIGNKVQKYVDGKPVAEGWPKGAPGERIQLVDGHFFGSAWHGTIRRFNSNLEPDPGVVLGGASGSFIGHLDQNSELSNARGNAKMMGSLYAISGFNGTLHIAQWDGSKQQFLLERRIGCVPNCTALGLDRNGQVWWHYGAWKWDDAPDAPIEQGVNSGEEFAQAVMLDSDAMVAPGRMWGKPAFWTGPLGNEVKTARIEKECALMPGMTATAAYRRADKLVLLVSDKSGKAASFFIGADGIYQGEAGLVAFKTSTPIKEITSLAMLDAKTLVIAADGAVIEMSADGNDWKESKRWSTWAADKFGAKIYLCADAGKLWVSDTERQRVLVFENGSVTASFGKTDQTDATLDKLSAPMRIAARGNKAVVHDAGNQRLMKLRMP